MGISGNVGDAATRTPSQRTCASCGHRIGSTPDAFEEKRTATGLPTYTHTTTPARRRYPRVSRLSLRSTRLYTPQHGHFLNITRAHASAVGYILSRADSEEGGRTRRKGASNSSLNMVVSTLRFFLSNVAGSMLSVGAPLSQATYPVAGGRCFIDNGVRAPARHGRSTNFLPHYLWHFPPAHFSFAHTARLSCTGTQDKDLTHLGCLPPSHPTSPTAYCTLCSPPGRTGTLPLGATSSSPIGALRFT